MDSTPFTLQGKLFRMNTGYLYDIINNDDIREFFLSQKKK